MAKVPVYGQDMIDLAPVPGVRQTGGATPEMFFDDGGAGMAGKALSKVGDAMMDIALKEQKQADEARALDAFTKLSKANTEAIYGKGGVISQTGDLAVGIGDRWTADFDKVSGELEKDLSPRQKEIYRKHAMTLKRGSYDGVLRHEATQARQFEEDAFKNTVAVGVDTAAKAWDNPVMIGTQMNLALEALRQRPAYLGASAGVREQMELEMKSAFHSQVVQSAIDADNTGYAKQYFEDNKKDMPLEARRALEKKLKPATDYAEGRDLALEVRDKIAKGELTETQAERYIYEKAKSKEAASNAQTVMREMQEAQKRETHRTAGALLTGFDERPSYAEHNRVLKDPRFQQLPEDEQRSIRKYMREELEQAEDRARTRANAQTPEKLVAFSEALEEVRANPSMSPTEITGKYGTKLGKDFTSRLISEAKELSGKASNFKIDADLLKEAVPESLRKPKTKADEQKLKAFNGIVERNLMDWKAANPGKIPTKEQQMAIARSANTDYLVIKDWWPDSTKKQYELTDSDQGTAVPKDFYEWSVAEARKRNKQITDEEIIAAWQRQKQKEKK